MSESKNTVVTVGRGRTVRAERIEVEAAPFEAPRNKFSPRTERSTGLGILGGAFLAGLSVVLAIAAITGVALLVTAGRILRSPFSASQRKGRWTFLTFSRRLLRR